MKTLCLICLVICAALLLTGCFWDHFNSAKMQEYIDDFAEALGASQITEDDALIGQRTYGEDAYAGGYFADCTGRTGRDVVFGGGSIEDRVMHCYGKVSTESGEACVRIRLNEEVYLLTLEPDGSFATELHLRSGGNYVMIDYSDFVGTVEMTCEYVGE